MFLSCTEEPAIKAAGLEAYRVDKDPGVSVPIESIERGIKQASICLADITTDNPNVWYELGYAFALGKPVVMACCSEERIGKKYPFDIQHRRVISYQADSVSDFDKLRDNLTAQITAFLQKGEMLQRLSGTDQIAPVEGLTQAEMQVLLAAIGCCFLPSHPADACDVKRDAAREGLTDIAIQIGIRGLIQKNFIEIVGIDDGSYNGSSGMQVTDSGWTWIKEHESKLVIHSPKREESLPDIEDDILF